MSESQFEKLLKTLKEKDAEIKRLTSALLHVEQLHSISEARKNAEIKRLRCEVQRKEDAMKRAEERQAEIDWLQSEVERLRDLVRDAYVEGRLALGAAENWASSKSKSKLEVSNE